MIKPIPQPNPSCPKNDERTDEQTDTPSRSLNSTQPQIIRKIPEIDSKPDRTTDRVKFMQLFNREGATDTHKKKPTRKSNKGRVQYKCCDIRQFYSYKLQQPPHCQAR